MLFLSSLAEKGHQVITTREPGATQTGKKIRSILLDPENSDISPVCELMLYGADRAQHISEVILPALKEKKTVLCDRFADATAAYQGFARGLDMKLIDNIHAMIAGGIKDSMIKNPMTRNQDATVLKPDLTILFDLDPVIGLERTFRALDNGERSPRESRFEQEHLDFHDKVRKGYLAIAHNEKERFIVVDASLSKESILNQIVSNTRFLQLATASRSF
ncbi:MAG: dTMP kinase [Desulfamplus sp.]|nr:dTMP kinase [Desulfamplus sp.]